MAGWPGVESFILLELVSGNQKRVLGSDLIENIQSGRIGIPSATDILVSVVSAQLCNETKGRTRLTHLILINILHGECHNHQILRVPTLSTSIDYALPRTSTCFACRESSV